MKIQPRLFSLILGVLCVVTLFSVISAQEPDQQEQKNQDVLKIIRLKPTSVEPDAVGFLKLVYDVKKQGSPKQTFELIGVNLRKSEDYFLVVGGSRLTSRKALVGTGEPEAVIQIEFTSATSKKTGFGGLPTELDPVTKIQHVEIRNANNQVVLTGDLPQ